MGIILLLAAIWLAGLVLSTEAGRKGLIIFLGFVIIVAVIIVLWNRGVFSSSHASTSSTTDAVIAEASRQAAEKEEQESHARIPVDKIIVRDFTITSSGKNVLTDPSLLSYAFSLDATASIKNNSEKFVLVGVNMKVSFLDCPNTQSVSDNECDKIQETTVYLKTDIPSGEVRLARASNFSLYNFPAPRGRLVIKPEILWTKARPLNKVQ